MNKQRLTDIQKYKLIIWAYSKISDADNVHRHHIKPKCLYPKLAKDPSNIAEVPGIVHWALHKLLLSHYKQCGNTKAVSKLKYVNLETYLNKGAIKYDFSKSDDIVQFIVQTCADFAKNWADRNDFQSELYHLENEQLDDQELQIIKENFGSIEHEIEVYKIFLDDSEKKCTDITQVLIHMSLVVYNQFGKDELDNFTDEEVIKLVNDIELADAMNNLSSIDEI